MRKFVIISDSACDLSKELRERFGIADYLKGVIYFPDNHWEYASLDWENISSDDFFNSMKSKKSLYKSGSAPLGETESVFEKYLKDGYDVLAITLSSALSCVYQNCVTLSKSLKDKYPERKILCVDSLRYSTALALLLVLASKKREQGASIEETAEYVEQIKHCIHQMGPMDDLFFLVRAGRISGVKAFFGTIVGINPMADFNHKGLSEVIVKFKGKKAALNATIKYIEKTIVNPSEQIIFIAHSLRPQVAQLLKQMIVEKFSPKEVIINHVGMSCGCSIGPGLCAAFYVGNPISEDCKVEKEIMSKIASSLN